jgi:predicted HTH domain antitoxin
MHMKVIQFFEHSQSLKMILENALETQNEQGEWKLRIKVSAIKEIHFRVVFSFP